MTTLETQLNSKRNAVKGTLTQAKGVAREKLGKVKKDPKMQLAGKKDQVVGTLQKTFGNSWGFRHKNIVLVTVLATIAATVYYFMNRSNNQSMMFESQSTPHYTY
jgi:uncharacterized protein YjbJ (UPF0337 family)